MISKKTKPLRAYRSKRNLTQTPEPKARIKRKKNSEPIFVVQKHDASHLHYDLRLEINGVLASWAVPKGLPRQSGIKRLAIQTEDHPYDYATFAGTIPAGNYGAGTVEIWDSGTYLSVKERNGKLIPISECVDEGSVEVRFFGKKLRGTYGLIRTHYGKDDKKSWLLFKIARNKKAGKPSILKV